MAVLDAFLSMKLLNACDLHKYYVDRCRAELICSLHRQLEIMK